MNWDFCTISYTMELVGGCNFHSYCSWFCIWRINVYGLCGSCFKGI